MKKTIPILAALVVLLAAAFFSLHGTGPMEGAGAPATKPVVLPRTVAAQVGVSSAGIPSELRTQARFTFLRDCHTYRRFSVLFASQAGNPDFPLNNPQKLAQMPPIGRQMLDDRVEAVKNYREKCSAWVAAIPDELASWQLYEATLAAASAGDAIARTCFVMAPWNPPAQQSASYAALRESYASFSRGFVDEQITRGNWTMVLAAYNASRAQHGLQTSLASSNYDRYVWARLLQMGSTDRRFAEGFGSSADRFASALNAVELAKADKEAAQTYRNYFSSRKMTDAEMYDNCGN